MKYDGGPAFPAGMRQGMSLRAYLAGQLFTTARESVPTTGKETWKDVARMAARRAVGYADEIIAELNRVDEDGRVE